MLYADLGLWGVMLCSFAGGCVFGVNSVGYFGSLFLYISLF